MKKTMVVILSLIIAVSSLAVSVSAVTPTYTTSEAYRTSKYYENLKAITLTGDQVTDVLAIALSQLGYHEGDSEKDMDGLNPSGVRDFVEYNVLYGKVDNQQGNGVSHGYSWCASFVNWCLRQARVSVEASAAAEISCRRWLAKCKTAGIYKDKKGYVPQAGDLIFFKDADSEVTSTHIGIVLTSNGKKVYTVEGNTSDGSEFSRDGNYVTTKKYALNSDYIVGYASPKYERDLTVPYVDCLGNAQGCGLLIATDEIPAYKNEDMSGEEIKIEPFTVFTVKDISNGIAKLQYKLDGKTGTYWAKIKGKAIQLEGVTADYSVSYVNSDGELLLTQYANEGDEITVAGALGTESLGGFVGWRFNMGEIDLIFRPDSEFKMGNGSISLHAIWDHEIYEVKFKDHEGNLISTDKGYFGDSIDVPAVAVPEGYYFAGWLEGEVSDSIRGDATYTAIILENGTERGDESQSVSADGVSGGADESEDKPVGESGSDGESVINGEPSRAGCRAGIMWGELLIALSAAFVAIKIKGRKN